MKKIDITKWKEFRVYEIFITEKNGSQVPTGANIPLKELCDGNIPKISVSGINNGIVGKYSSNHNNFRVYENFISVSFLGTVFYHKYKAFLDMKVHCLKPIKRELNDYSGLFIVGIVKQALQNFSYSDQISSSVLPNLSIKMPINEEGELDREYMENYMKNIEIKVKKKIQELKKERKSKKINLQKWGTFHLYDKNLFDIDSGSKLDKSKMRTDEPEINFVGRANANNGITTAVNRIDNISPYHAGYLTLSLGGEYLGSCFIQPKDFYTSQNVVVLKPKRDMSFYVKQFIANIIFKEGRTHYKAFSDELNRHIKTDFSIKLPITPTGEPDRNYMENYMKNIEIKVKNGLQKIRKNIGN